MQARKNAACTQVAEAQAAVVEEKPYDPDYGSRLRLYDPDYGKVHAPLAQLKTQAPCSYGSYSYGLYCHAPYGHGRYQS